MARAFLSNLEQSGEHNGAVQFSATWLISGVFTGLSVLTLTSRPYPIEAMDSVGVSAGPGAPGLFIRPDAVLFDVAVEPLGGELFGGLIDYTLEPHEFDVAMQPLGGELFGGLIAYSGPPEFMDVTMEPLGGELFGDLITYSTDTETLDVAMEPLGGTLE